MSSLNIKEGDINLTSARRAWQHSMLDDDTRALLERDSNVFLHQSMSTPCLNALSSCEGAYITDVQGRKLLDFHGNNVHQVGFGNPAVKQAIIEQLETLPFCTRRYTNEQAVMLAEKLVELTQGLLQRVLFAPGATSAIGMALKLARIATGKHKTLSFWDSFHGASLDAISVGGEGVFRGGIGPLLPGCEHLIPYNSYRCPMGDCEVCRLKCLKQMEYILEREQDIGAIIIETIRNTDVQIPSVEYYREIRRLCDKYGVLLILDETAICLGRTGEWFAYQNYGIVPDMVVCGKGLGGGIMPLAALVVKEELNSAGHVSLGHYTHEKSPVACAASIAAIKYIEQHNLLQAAQTKGYYFGKILKAMGEKYPFIGDVRSIGLLHAIELVTDKLAKTPGSKLAETVMYGCLTDGLSFKVSSGNVISLYPPLIASEEELGRAASIIEDNLIRALHYTV